MTTFNKGIRTQAGKDLANRVMAGKTSITYSRLVFSSEDLSDKSDDELSELTDVEPQELAVEPDTIDLKATDVTDPETEVRAIAKNDPLTAGLHVRTYGLYAKDDSGNEILFGVALDDNPAYLPPHESGDQDQYLTYEWDTALKDTDNIKFTNTKMVFVNFDELNRYKSAVNTTVASLEADDTNLSNSAKADYANAAGSVSSLQDSAASYTDYRAGSALATANVNMEGNRVSLSNSVNGLPHWNDINYTRSVIATSLATSALNAANGFTYNKATSIDAQLADKQNQLNDRPLWNDENFTRSNIAPALANSARDAANGYTNAKADSLNSTILSNTLSFSNYRSSDLNDYTEKGFYNLGGEKYKHTPFDNPNNSNTDNAGNMFGTLMVTNFGDGILQLLFRIYGAYNPYDYNQDGGAMYFRTHAKVWSTWKTVASNEQINDLINRINSHPQWTDENVTRQQAINSANNLQNQINGLPKWTDINWTRNNVAPALANSARDAANGYTNTKANDLTNAINSTQHNLQASTITFSNSEDTDLNNYTNKGFYNLGGATYKHTPFDNPNNSNRDNAHNMFGTLMVSNFGDGIAQVLFRIYGSYDPYDYGQNGGAIYFRTHSSYWSTWKTVASNEQINDLINRINSRPSWIDENQTRSNADQAATNAMNQANGYTNDKANVLQNQINTTLRPNTNASTDLNTYNNVGVYALGGGRYTHTPFDNSNNSNTDNAGNMYGSLAVLGNGQGYLQILTRIYGSFDRYDFNQDGGAVYFRIGTGNGSWGAWKTVQTMEDHMTASNENDARNMSNVRPGVLVLYPG